MVGGPSDVESLTPIFATTDSGANMRKAIELGQEFAHIPCFAHKLHRVMICAVAKNSWLV